MTALCCKQCFLEIASIDRRTAEIWTNLCACFIEFEGCFKFREHVVPKVIKHLKRLEELGYITTIDGVDGIAVRVNGYDIIEEDNLDCLETFCLDRERHESDLA